MAITAEQARVELAKRELARRSSLRESVGPSKEQQKIISEQFGRQASAEGRVGAVQALTDIAAVPYHFVNQLAFNAPRAISNMAMPGAGENIAQAGGIPARVAGVAGGIMSPLNKFMLFQKAGLGQKALAGAAQGALYSPNEDILGLQQRAVQAGVGGVLGPASEAIARPVSRFLAPRAEKASRAIGKAGKAYRNILRPTQGEIKKVELKLGKDINKYYRLAAEEGLPITSAEDNKLDTREALAILKEKNTVLEDNLQSELASGATVGGKRVPSKYSLDEVASEAKKRIEDRFRNAKEAEVAKSYIDDIIKAEKNRYGDVVDASKLNTVKRGMWERSYGIMEPNNDDAARVLGTVIKEKIEKDFPAVRNINQKSADYLNLTSLLRNSHGRVIAKGRIGQHVAGLLGGGIGGAIGHSVLPGVGTAAGALAGKELAELGLREAVRPERISAKASKLAQKYQGPESKFVEFIRSVRGKPMDYIKKYREK